MLPKVLRHGKVVAHVRAQDGPNHDLSDPLLRCLVQVVEQGTVLPPQNLKGESTMVVLHDRTVIVEAGELALRVDVEAVAMAIMVEVVA